MTWNKYRYSLKCNHGLRIFFSFLLVIGLYGEGSKVLAQQTFTDDELMGRFEPSKHPGFSKVPAGFSTRKNDYLRTEVLVAFMKMTAAAKADGVDLLIVSATRNFNRQVVIWERKWDTFGGSKRKRAAKILRYSSMPGTSRHHWGTDFDLNSVNPSYFNTKKGKKVYEWLRLNAYKFGFFQPYQTYPEIDRSGYEEEKWHWSYYPTASVLLAEYNARIDEDKIEDFDGSKYAERSRVLPDYVNGIVTAPFPLGQFPIPGSPEDPILMIAAKSQLASSKTLPDGEIQDRPVDQLATSKPPRPSGPTHITSYYREGPSYSSGPQLTFSQWMGKE